MKTLTPQSRNWNNVEIEKALAVARYQRTLILANSESKEALDYQSEALDIEARPCLTFNDLWIRPKIGKSVRLVPNPIQAAFLDEVCPLWKTGDYRMSGRRDLILKSRQFGFSTIIIAILFLLTLNYPNTYSAVVAMKGDNARTLFGIMQYFWIRLPSQKRMPDGTFWMKPKPKYNNRGELFFADLNSKFYLGSAENSDFGRGGSPTNLHFSEAAFYSDADKLVAGALQGLPMQGNCFVESTANGIGNWYEQNYRESEKGEGAFKAFFYAWCENSEYRAPLPEGGIVLTKAESLMMDSYNLDLEQIQWYRIKEREVREKMPQEYPGTAAEAFLVSGNPYFKRERLREIEAALGRPEFAALGIDEFECDREPLRLLIHAAMEGRKRQKTNTLTIWEPPVEGRHYCIGADVSEGLTDNGLADYDSADVIDLQSGIQVAHLYGKWDTAEYGRLLAHLGHWYNYALIAVERNNHGHSVLNTLYNECSYGECDRDLRGGIYTHEEFDEYTKIGSRKMGWPTTSKSKPQCLDRLATSLIENQIRPRDPLTIAECMSYVKLPGSKSGGEGKSHDDCVMSLAIGEMVRTMIPKNYTIVSLPPAGFVESVAKVPDEVKDAYRKQDDIMRAMDPILRKQLRDIGL